MRISMGYSVLYLLMAVAGCVYVYATLPEDTGEWVLKPGSGVPREGAEAIVYNDKLYIFSGFENNALEVSGRTERYDPESGNWMVLTPMPIPITHHGAAKVGEQIWFAGGFAGNHQAPPTDAVQIYHPDSDRWTMGPPLPRPMGSSELVYLQGKLHTFGGNEPDRQTNITDHYVLDLENPAAGWEAAAPMLYGVTHFAAVALEGKIYALGGEFGHDVVAEDVPLVQVYDPATDSWERKKDMPFPRSHVEQATFVHNGHILMVGGKSYRELAIPAISAYDPASDSWRELPPLPYGIVAPSARVVNGMLLVAYGGKNSYAHLQDTLWMRPMGTDHE